MVFCAFCGDEYDPVEFRESDRVDPDEPSFCSDHCEDLNSAQEEKEFAYDMARDSGSPAL